MSRVVVSTVTGSRVIVSTAIVSTSTVRTVEASDSDSLGVEVRIELLSVIICNEDTAKCAQRISLASRSAVHSAQSLGRDPCSRLHLLVAPSAFHNIALVLHVWHVSGEHTRAS